MNAYQMYSQLLFSKAGTRGIPLSGTFELTSRCNFDCKMCYIHRRAHDSAALSAEKNAKWWLSLAEECCKEGMLLLLITGGEPLLRPDFREIYEGCRKQGLMVSVNTNGSLLDKKMVDFLAKDPPARMNLTLYGASRETYGALCGQPEAYDRVIHAILALKEAGVLLKLNYSITPQNRHDAQKIYAFARQHELALQAASYMFPPVRACEQGSCTSERLTPGQAALEKMNYDRSRFSPEELRERWEKLLDGKNVPDPQQECQDLPTERIRCRAGSCTFWTTWDGKLRPCGMMTQPEAELVPGDFHAAWQRIRTLREEIMVPAKCTACKMRNACDQCPALCWAETGSFTGVPDYMCQETEHFLRLIREELGKHPVDE